MTWGAVAIGGATVLGGIVGSSAQRSAASQAADAQTIASQQGIAEQQRQFDAVQKLLAPYTNAGTSSLSAQQDLLGLNGNGAQQTAIAGIQNGPQFQSMLKQGENSILANASATGGLRGGSTQAALAQFSPTLLSQLINDQYSKLGGLTSLGQNSAAGVGNAGMQTGNNVANLLQQQGAAQAGSALAAGKADAQLWNTPASALGTYFGLGGGKAFGITGAKF
jgi:hypothetical protein